ncbi:MAG: hypothetical protein IKS17_02900 [Firmicutes bacterium]|nr:hypothetical protein [Bacillota bacterium]
MAKTAGIILVAITAVIYSLTGLIGLEKRLADVKMLLRALLFINSGINGMVPLREIFTQLCESESADVFGVFLRGMDRNEKISDIWRECLDKTSLIKTEKAVFMPLGACLGCAERSIQLKTADMAAQNAALLQNELTKSIKKYREVDMKLRIMAGITVIVLFI